MIKYLELNYNQFNFTGGKMSKINWNNINQEDIIEAINVFETEKPKYLNPKGLFLCFNTKKYPAKTIRKIAFNIKNNDYISEDQFKGGSYTVKFFNNLGFDMELNGTKYLYTDKKPKTNKTTKTNSKKFKQTKDKSTKNNITNSTKTKDDKIKISIKNVLEQKNALQLLLNKIFDGDVVNERTFEWMKTPKNPQKTYHELYESLKNYRNDTKFAKKNYQIQGCDFVSESNKIIIEYDERQHFTEARRLSLLSYPDIPVFFDKKLWIKASEDIQAIDNTPYNRDEIRAYYDSIRDIEAYNNGYALIRIMHGEFDFEKEEAYEYLEQLIKTNKDYFNRTISSRTTSISNNKQIEHVKKKNTPPFQKNAIQLLLNKIFDNDLVCEKAFDWMKTPENPPKYSKLYNSLKQFNDDKSPKNKYRLHCDFVSESNKVIIEYDERAHFTEARRISLLNYPDIKFHYDKDKWIESCENIGAKNKSKYNSDTNRAYYDSIRDIEAYNHGYKLIRIKHGEFDFYSENAYEYLEKLIFPESYE